MSTIIDTLWDEIVNVCPPDQMYIVFIYIVFFDGKIK